MKGKLATLALGAGMLALAAPAALADHGAGGLPADKVVVAATNTLLADTNTNDTNTEGKTLFGPISYKMSSSGDIIVSVHQECKIVTETTVKGGGADGGPVTQDSERGFARVWIEIQSHDDSANYVVLNTSEFANEGDPNADPAGTAQAVNAGAVTMCDRLQDLRLSSTGDEILTLKLATLQTHGFTWFGEDIAKTNGAEGYPIGNEVDIFVKGEVFGERGGIIEVRKRVVEIDTAHFAN